MCFKSDLEIIEQRNDVIQQLKEAAANAHPFRKARSVSVLNPESPALTVSVSSLRYGWVTDFRGWAPPSPQHIGCRGCAASGLGHPQEAEGTSSKVTPGARRMNALGKSLCQGGPGTIPGRQAGIPAWVAGLQSCLFLCSAWGGVGGCVCAFVPKSLNFFCSTNYLGRDLCSLAKGPGWHPLAWQLPFGLEASLC